MSFKKGGKLVEKQCPRGEMGNVDKLSVSFKKESVKVSFEVTAPGPDIRRLIHFSRSGHPLNVTVESPQAEFDLEIKEVNVETGLIRD